MTGLEVLGAFAAASQLAQQGVQILSFLRGIRGVPESISKKSVQLERLLDITELVKENPALQTPLIDSILSKCVVETRTLQGILEKVTVDVTDGRIKKLWKSLEGTIKEKQVLSSFAKLEQEKSSLALCIQTVDASLLHNIHHEHHLEFVAVKKGMNEIMQRLPALQISDRPENTPKRHFIVPYARNAEFVGRRAQLDVLTAKLDVKGRHNRVALVGLGGVGKTQIALEYAYCRYEDASDVSVYWIHASNASRFEQDYVQIGVNAGLSGMNDPNQNPKDMVKQWLRSKEPGTWLLIIDNADDADLFFRPITSTDGSATNKRLSEFLPQCTNGSILFTTRNHKAGFKFTTTKSNLIHLTDMEVPDAEKLLHTRLGGDVNDQAHTTELLELLEYLPLAISQAASFIAENNTSLPEYLRMYNESESSRMKLLSQDFEELGRDSEAKNPIATTWAISFDQIRRSDMNAINILSYMACLDRRAIPKALLPAGESPVELSNSLGLLKAYSLVKANDKEEFFDIHRLVYLATRNWLRSEGKFGLWAQRSLDLVSREFPWVTYENLKTFEKCDLYISHANAVLEYDQLSPVNDSSWSRLVRRVCWYYRQRGNYNTVEVLTSRALEWITRAFGEESLEVLDCLSYLAWTKYFQEDLETAKGIQEQILAGYEKKLGLEAGSTLRSIIDLALTLKGLGKLDECERLQQQVLQGFRKRYGSEHPDVLLSMSYLAETWLKQSKYEAAENMLRQALVVSERISGLEHQHTLYIKATLAFALGDQGKYEEAEEMHRQTLAITERKFGVDHPTTLRSLARFSALYYDQERYDDAIILLQRLYATSVKVWGPNDARSLDWFQALSGIQQEQQEIQQEQQEIQQAQMREEVTEAI